jgi:glycosyltransferase involved in cell wall biosynthesis
LFVHAALTPYRIDLLNYLHEHLAFKAVFLRSNPASQAFDQAALRNRLECDHEYLLRGFEIGGKVFRAGLSRIIHRFDPDVIVTQEFSPTTLWLACIAKRLCRSRWGLTVLTADNERIAGDAGLVRRLARRLALGAADTVIVYTQTAKAWLSARGVASDRIFICPNLQNEARFAAALDDALPLANRSLVEKGLRGRRLALVVGRLVELKGIDRVIQAFAQARREVPDATLVIVGDGPERERLQRLAAATGVAEHVRFEGQQLGRSLMAWYLLGHVLVLASHWECYGAVVNEALLAGIPVLCSSWAGAAELIRANDNGHLFHPYDVAALSQKLTAYLQAVAPLGRELISRRPSLMPVPFEDAARAFVQAVHLAAVARRRDARALSSLREDAGDDLSRIHS